MPALAESKPIYLLLFGLKSFKKLVHLLVSDREQDSAD